MLCQDTIRILQDMLVVKGDTSTLKNLSVALPFSSCDKVFIIQLGIWGPQVFMSGDVHLEVTHIPYRSITFSLDTYDIKLSFSKANEQLVNVSICPTKKALQSTTRSSSLSVYMNLERKCHAKQQHTNKYVTRYVLTSNILCVNLSQNSLFIEVLALIGI